MLSITKAELNLPDVYKKDILSYALGKTIDAFSVSVSLLHMPPLFL